MYKITMEGKKPIGFDSKGQDFRAPQEEIEVRSFPAIGVRIGEYIQKHKPLSSVIVCVVIDDDRYDGTGGKDAA